MDKDLNIQFYDELSEDYHLIFDSWEDAIKRQALILKGIITEYAKPDALTVLDCACGIGTQAIGLASLGYQVCAAQTSAQKLLSGPRWNHGKEACLCLLMLLISEHWIRMFPVYLMS